MNQKILISLVLFSLFAICTFSCAQTGPAASGKASEPSRKIARGKYIVEGLSRCGQCHTPRDSSGQPDREHWLEGAAVWLKPAEPVQDWPLKAPRLAGTPPAGDAGLVRLLTTGIWTNGKPLRDPMPQFRMTQEDAEAVVAYLRSLSPPPR